MGITVTTSYLHIAKRECQCVDRSVDVSEKLLFVVVVHLLKVHSCQIVMKQDKSQDLVANLNSCTLKTSCD